MNLKTWGMMPFIDEDVMTARTKRKWLNAYRSVMMAMLGIVSYFLIQTHNDIREYFKEQRSLEQRVSRFEGRLIGIDRQLDRIEDTVFRINLRDE